MFLNTLGHRNLSSLFIPPAESCIDIVPYFILSNLAFIKKCRTSYIIVLVIYLLAALVEFTAYLFFSFLPYFIKNLIYFLFLIVYFLISLFTIDTDWQKLLYVFLMTLNYKAIINAAKKVVSNPAHEGGSDKQIVISLIGYILTLLVYLLLIKKIKFRMELWKSEISDFSILLTLMFFLIFSSISGTDFVNRTGMVNYALYIIIITLIQTLFNLLIDKLLIRAKETELLEQKVKMLNVKMSEQDELFKSLESSIKEVRETRHNLRHHLLLIKEYIDRNDKDHLLEYLDKIQYPLYRDMGPSLCKNSTANAVISHFVKIAEKECIEVSLNLQLPEVLDISDDDLCVILGNCLENAVEACRRMKNGRRYIRLSAVYKGNFLAIALDNSFDGVILKKDDTYFSRKRVNEEGIGISTIRSVVSKYNGVAEFKNSQNQFETSILLNCRPSQHAQDFLPHFEHLFIRQNKSRSSNGTTEF